jgi:integrase
VLFERLLTEGRLDILRALADGSISWTELHGAARDGKLGEALHQLVLRRPLRDVVDSLWPKDVTGTARTYRTSMNKLLRLLPPKATVASLQRVSWEPLGQHYVSGANWNHMRRAVSRLHSLLIGKHHPIRHETLARIPIWPEHDRIPDVSIEDLQRFLGACPEWLRDVALTLLGTGMRMGEFFGGELRNGVFYCGTKTRASRRELPIADALLPVVQRALALDVTYPQIRAPWKAACEAAGLPDFHRHDCRHIAAQLLSDAGRPLTSIQATLGHSSIHQTVKYAARRLRKDDADQLAESLKDLLVHR